MRQKTERQQGAAERTIKDIRRQTRKRYSSEEKIRIVLAGLRGEDSIAELRGGSAKLNKSISGVSA
jgi:transposase